ncbi:CHAD domain-containing protein [Agromyces tardus]|uniref:CHAD domain-containing protein n=2 Tax=Agromyces tardus TaxID=2583849 RepID=A0A3M8AGL2_9MICO|nr:CHAD domain-containing protein [Agromyces tardus]
MRRADIGRGPRSRLARAPGAYDGAMGDGEAQGSTAEHDNDVEVDVLDAGTAMLTALRAVGERMSQLEPAVLADEPDAVHQLRTYVRRLRSLLAAYGPLFDVSVATGLRRRYRTFGRELGVVRDLEVRVQVAERALAEAAEEGVIADAEEREAVQARLIDAERASHALAHARLAERERSARADARRDALQVFLDDPPRTALAAQPAKQVLGALLELEARHAVRRSERLDDASDTETLHAVRKAGRRLRYAAEAVSKEPLELFDGRAHALASVGDDLHDLLGDHRDEVLFAEHVRRMAAHAAHDGAPAAAFERLAVAADARAASQLKHLPKVVRDLRSATRAWESR